MKGCEENSRRGRRGRRGVFKFLMVSFRGTCLIPMGADLSAEADVLIMRWGMMDSAYVYVYTHTQGLREAQSK